MKMMRKLVDFEELWPAGQKLVDELDSGKLIDLHDSVPPDVPDDVKWSCKTGQSVKVYSNTKKEYQNDEETEVFRPV